MFFIEPFVTEEILNIDDEISFKLQCQCSSFLPSFTSHPFHSHTFIVCLLQSQIRSFQCRSAFLQLRNAVLQIQFYCKTIKVQSYIRSFLIQSTYYHWSQQIKESFALQSLYSGELTRATNESCLSTKSLSHILSRIALGKRSNSIGQATKERKISELTRKNTSINSGYKYCKFNYQNKYVSEAPLSPSLRLSERENSNGFVFKEELQHLPNAGVDSSRNQHVSRKKRIKWDENFVIFRPDVNTLTTSQRILSNKGESKLKQPEAKGYSQLCKDTALSINSPISSCTSSASNSFIDQQTDLTKKGKLKNDIYTFPSSSFITSFEEKITVPSSPVTVNIQNIVVKKKSYEPEVKKNKSKKIASSNEPPEVANSCMEMELCNDKVLLEAACSFSTNKFSLKPIDNKTKVSIKNSENRNISNDNNEAIVTISEHNSSKAVLNTKRALLKRIALK